MADRLDIVVLGEALIDEVIDAAGVRKEVPGGSPINTAVALGRMNYKVGAVARMSSDAGGQLLRNHLQQSGASLELIIDAPQPTARAIATITPDGSANYEFKITNHTDGEWTIDELPTDLNSPKFFVVTGALFDIAPGLADCAQEIMQCNTKNSVILFDPNIRPPLVSNHERYRSTIERICALASVVKMSDEDCAFLFGDSSYEEAAQMLRDCGADVVIFTRGAQGSILFDSYGNITERPAASTNVVDTIGAGDTFSAGVIKYLFDNGITTRDDVIELSEAQFIEMLDLASHMAALTCSQPGANPPTLQQLLRHTQSMRDKARWFHEN